jgi:hypothetical protein
MGARGLPCGRSQKLVYGHSKALDKAIIEIYHILEVLPGKLTGANKQKKTNVKN